MNMEIGRVSLAVLPRAIVDVVSLGGIIILLARPVNRLQNRRNSLGLPNITKHMY